MNRERQIDLLILLGIAELFSEQSTFLINELRHEKKQQFNLAVKQVDLFMKTVKNGLDEHNKETLNILVESLNDGVHQLRKTLNEAT